MWSQKAFLRISNYLSRYDVGLRKRLSTFDPFAFNRDSLVRLLNEVKDRLNTSNSKILRFDVIPTPLQVELLNFLSRCDSHLYSKVSTFLKKHLYNNLIEVMFPTASDIILRRYRKITKRFVLKDEDLLNILKMIQEGWLSKEVMNLCTVEDEKYTNYRFMKSAPETIVGKLPEYLSLPYYANDNLIHLSDKRRKSSPVGPIPSYQSYFMHLIDL